MIPVKIIGAKIYSIPLFQVNPEFTNPNQQDPVQVHAHQFLFSKEKFVNDVSNSMAAFDFTSEIENINQVHQDQDAVIQKLPTTSQVTVDTSNQDAVEVGL